MKVVIVRAPNVDEMKDQKDVTGLIIALKDDDATIRYRAAQALDKLRDLRAARPLTNALRDEAVTVRARAAEALGWLGVGRTVEPLVQALALVWAIPVVNLSFARVKRDSLRARPQQDHDSD